MTQLPHSTNCNDPPWLRALFDRAYFDQHVRPVFDEVLQYAAAIAAADPETQAVALLYRREICRHADEPAPSPAVRHAVGVTLDIATKVADSDPETRAWALSCCRDILRRAEEPAPAPADNTVTLPDGLRSESDAAERLGISIKTRRAHVAGKLQDRLPYAPRAMRAERAAAYLDMSTRTFLRLVDEGLLPPPIKIRGVVTWDRLALDAAYENLKSGESENTVHKLLSKEE